MANDEMQAQYEVFPYPERDPKDEARRLITGSPSWPQEMDHWLWGGARNWSAGTRILVAGGGTGDALIQLAQTLTSAGHPYKITYVDMSKAARKIAEARAGLRGLKDIEFVTGSLLDAEKYGPFDYIDCCGVLHHLPDPQAGFDALARALAPGGGIGLMVYAPLGRSGVYPLQSAFMSLLKRMEPKDKLVAAKRIYELLPDGHPFKRNPNLVDHNASDAGFYDLLLHSSDRPYSIGELAKTLTTAGLEIAGMPEPALYDPNALLPKNVASPGNLGVIEKMSLAENLRGTFKTHIIYAALAGSKQAPPLGQQSAVPHLKGIDPRKLAQTVAQKGAVQITAGGQSTKIKLPKASAPLIASINGRRDLATIRTGSKLDMFAFGALWGPVEKALTGYGQMHYSTFLKIG